MQILSIILLLALCILANAKVVMRISNSIGDGKNAKFYYCRHFMKPSKGERPASIKFVSSYPKVEETIKVTSTRLPRRLTASLRLCWRLKLSKTLDLPKGHYKVQYLNAAGNSIGLESILHSSIIINRGREPPKPAPYVYVSDFQKELLTYAKKDTKFPSAYSTTEPDKLPRRGQLEAAVDRAIPFKIVDTTYDDLEYVDGDNGKKHSGAVYAKGPDGIDVVIKFVRRNVISIPTIDYVNEREALFKLGRLLQYDDVNLFLVTPRIFGESLKSIIEGAEPSDYQQLLDACSQPILELNKLGIAKFYLGNPRDFLIDDEQKCHTIDFGGTYILDNGNQLEKYTNRFNLYWDQFGPLRPYYQIQSINFVPTSAKTPATKLVYYSVKGRYGNEQDAVLHVSKYLNYDISQDFSFKSGFGIDGKFPIFDNLKAVHSEAGSLIASDESSGLILAPKIKGKPLSMFKEDKAKQIWTKTIARLHEKNILVGYISSENIVVDEDEQGHLENLSYALMLEKPFIDFGSRLVQEKKDLEMQFLQHIQEHCPISGKANPPFCDYKPSIRYSAVADFPTIEEVINAASQVAIE